jgi:iron complex outermembrane recepter protein
MITLPAYRRRLPLRAVRADLVLKSGLSLLALTTFLSSAGAQQPPAPTPTGQASAPTAEILPPQPAAQGAQATQGPVVIKPVDVVAKEAPLAPPKQPAPVRRQPAPAQAAAPSAPTSKVSTPPPQATAVPILAAPTPVATGSPQTGNQITPGLPAASVGQTVTTIDGDRSNETKRFSVGDILQESPGISIKQGNGPRDMGVSIRGSNARNGFGVRNVQVFEDGFNVTQPDGLSRTDLTDPHAYGGIDVWRGPSSALFGNYATGGAINFRTRSGREIDGFEYGIDVGSFGYLNNYLALGKQVGAFEYALFASDVRGKGQLDWSNFNTQTINFTGSYTPTTSDKFTVKFIRNDLDANLSVRLNMNQFLANPYQSGCRTTFALAAANCGSVSLFTNGFNGAKISNTAAQAGLGREDHRTILGARWEHKVDEKTSWQVQYVLDDRDIDQPTGATSAIGDFRSQNISANLKHEYDLLGIRATHLSGVWFNYLPANGDTFNVAPGGNATLGKRTQNTSGMTQNMGANIREEFKPTTQWTIATGAAYEQSLLKGTSTAFTYGAASTGNPTSTAIITADRTINNAAWDLSAAYRVKPMWLLRSRVATGYGTPQFSNLFVQSDGTAGNNTQLQSQTNLGVDAGFDFTPTKSVKISFTAFQEYYRNELVTQSPVTGTSFTFNAPKSEHRGIEIGLDWRFLQGWKLAGAYTLNDQIYKDYQERLAGNAQLFDRAGNKIPGVSPQEWLARLGYDQEDGTLKGLGAFVEYQWKDAFYMDNGNKLQAPGYGLTNVNVHFKTELPASSFVRGLTTYFEIRNVFDKTYVASANSVTNSQTVGVENGASSLAAGSGSIYAGSPRTYYGGVKLKF